jgi:exopolyphosphatase/guanosine-5'-triphosphate,3'-diphosphate pyrophosphatase
MGTTAYSIIVIVLGIANVVLAAVAYSQRARQLAGRALSERQVALAARRNEMAAARMEILDRQVGLLMSIRDSMVPKLADRWRDADAGRAVGVIDVGSTTVRLVVATPRRGQGLKTTGDERAFLHLGAEVQRHGRYSAETLRAVAARVAALQHHAGSLGCKRLAIILTAPGRRGENPGELAEAIEQAAGRQVTALSAVDEAQLAFLGAASLASSSTQRLVVCDVGGGSTELAFGTAAGGVVCARCFDTGALTLAERHFRSIPPSRDDLQRAQRDAARSLILDDVPPSDVLLATGGSARAIAKVAGTVADAADLKRVLAMSLRPSKSTRRRLGQERLRSLPAGIVLLAAVQAQLALPLTVSRAGLRDGVLQTLLDSPGGLATASADAHSA